MHLFIAQVAPVTSAGEKFLQQGLLGSAVFVLALVVYALWRHSTSREDFWLAKLNEKDTACRAEREGLLQAHKTERDTLQQTINQLNAARATDAREVSTELKRISEKATEALVKNSEAMEKLPQATESILDGMRAMTEARGRR